MEKLPSSYNFKKLELLLEKLYFEHGTSVLNSIKDELNRFFMKSKCTGVMYTNNTDKMFFGMKVYVIFPRPDATLTEDQTKIPEGYMVEFDSKLFDPMLNLEGAEFTAILLHEVGHIAYDTGTIDEIKKQVDMYYVNDGDTGVNGTKNPAFRQLLGYALADACIKIASIFTKFGNDESIADSFVVSYGYGPYLESAIKKILMSTNYLTSNVDNRLITLSWVLRLRRDFNTTRVPIIKTLNKAKQLTGSQLEKNQISNAANIMRQSQSTSFEEGVFENIKNKFAQKINNIKVNGIRAVRNDIYDLNLRLRTAEIENDLRYIIKQCNINISILQEYLEEDISDQEREATINALQELYDIRQRAAKHKEVRDGNSLITVVYT